MHKLILLLSCILAANLAAADYPLEIIDLKGRPADEIIPIIQPFVGTDGVVVGKNNQLFIRAAPDRMQEIHRILEAVDRPPRQLLISVRQGNPVEATGERIGVATPRKSVSIHASGYHTKRRGDVTQRLRTTEGKPAFINTGRSVPIQNQTLGVLGYGNTTYYRDASTGFFVVPSVNGNRVTLQIHQRTETPSHGYPQDDMQFDYGETRATVSGRLEEWITISGTENSDHKDRPDTRVRAGTRSKRDWTVQVRVEVLP